MHGQLGRPDVDREHPGVRAELVQRGLAIDAAQFTAVTRLLGLTDPDTIAAIHWDRHQVTVIRRPVIRVRTPGPGLNGPATVVEHTHQSRQHIPIINMPEEG